MFRIIGITLAIVGVIFGGTIQPAGTAPTDHSTLAVASIHSEHLLEIFMVGGRPRNLDDEHPVTILVNQGYAVGYSTDRRNPVWAAYKATKLHSGEAFRYDRPQFFMPDRRVNPAVDGRTFGGGMDRGHMVPNAVIGNQWGTLAQNETFFMTNMCPQAADLNQGPWMRLESWIPEAAQSRGEIWVLAGPIFGADPSTVAGGPDRDIQVPDAFYMILVDTSFEWNERPTVKTLAYIFPQTTARTADFTARQLFGRSIDEIEAATGLDFFPEWEARWPAWWQNIEAGTEMVHWQD